MTYVICFIKIFIYNIDEVMISMYYLTTIFCGSLITIMTFFNSQLTQLTDIYFATFFIHLTGLFISIVILKFNRAKLSLDFCNLGIYCGGLIGIFTVLFQNMSIAKLGISTYTLLSLLGQLTSSLIIEKTTQNIFSLNNKKILGLSIIILGVVMVIW